jgi:hypothetical protein
MKTEPHTLTRREALLSALQGTVAASLAVPLSATGAELPAVPETEFVPEHDYPFFGWEPEGLA